MKLRNLFVAITTFGSIVNAGYAQTKRINSSPGREKFIEVEKNVKLHVTDIGEGNPLVLIHGWPLSDAV
jgi:hypothetical protein